MKNRIILASVLAMAMAASGCVKIEETSTLVASTDVAETVPATKAVTEETTETTEEDAAASAWFTEGDYTAIVDGEDKELLYHFDDETSGSVDDGDDVKAFTCEQSEGEVVFQFEDEDDERRMFMEDGEDGSFIGTVLGVTYIFTSADVEAETEETTEEEEEDVLEAPPLMGAFEGTYADPVAGRATIEIYNKGAGQYSVKIHWSNSAYDTYIWEFTGTTDEENVLNYEDCMKSHIVFDEDDSETTELEYSDGVGAMKLTDQGLVWIDEEEGAADDMVFIKQ